MSASHAMELPAPSGPRRYLCPACRRVSMLPTRDPALVARCDACGWGSASLLDLIPVRPAPLMEVVFGPGSAGYARAVAFVAAIVGGFALVVWRP